MFDIKDHICAAGAAVCEDAVGWGRDYLFALDGASGLTGARLMEEGSDAAWFAAGVRDGLCRRLDGGDRRSTAEILAEVLAELRQAYEARAAELGIPVPPDSPSAGLALFRELGEQVEFFGLGDCVGAAEKTDGGLFSSCDTALPALDRQVVMRMAAIRRETGISVLNARKQCGGLLLEHRMLRNRPGGYWILDPSGAGLSHARIRRWRRDELRTVSVFSDGFAQLAEPFRLYDGYEALHMAATNIPLQALVEQLFSAQEADPEANRFPRLKFRDDTCALWARVLPCGKEEFP